MEFCNKCQSLIVVKEGKAICAACGTKASKKPKLEVAEKITHTDSVAVINEQEASTYPIVDNPCPKCKNHKSFFWTKQTRSSDESETKFYKCIKCNHTWRKYR
jgi:transcription factor S